MNAPKTQERRCVSLRRGVLDLFPDHLADPAVEVVDLLGDTEVVEPLDLPKGLLDPLVAARYRPCFRVRVLYIDGCGLLRALSKLLPFRCDD